MYKKLPLKILKKKLHNKKMEGRICFNKNDKSNVS